MIEPELMHQLLEAACDFGASDLHLAVGDPPVLRVHGDLQPLDMPVLEPEDTELLMKTICTTAAPTSASRSRTARASACPSSSRRAASAWCCARSPTR